MDEDYINSHIDIKFVSEKAKSSLERLLGFISRFTVQHDNCSFYVKVNDNLLEFCSKENNRIIVINAPDGIESQTYLEAEPHWTAFDVGSLRCKVYHKFFTQFSSA